jgi:hypothetical protein
MAWWQVAGDMSERPKDQGAARRALKRLGEA